MSEESAHSQEIVTPIKVAVHQPQFLPWAGFLHKLVSCDLFILFAGVKFDKSSCQHRVTVNNGQWLTLPVVAHSRSLPIKDVRLSNTAALLKIARTIRQTIATRRAPYADRLGPVITLLETWSDPNLLDLLVALQNAVCCALEVSREVVVDLDTRTPESGVFDGKVARLQACLADHTKGNGHIYLSGAGSRAYMNSRSLTRPIGETWFQRVLPGTSGDSCLQSIAHDENPLETIKACAVWETAFSKEVFWNGVSV